MASEDHYDHSDKMEVDGVASSSSPSSIQIHPLAICGISEHWERVVGGSSPLAKDSKVMGLLYGNQARTQILDAEEMVENKNNNNTTSCTGTRIELRREVFPKQFVVGWYKVSTTDDDDEDVKPEDVEIHESMKQYCGENPMFLLFSLQNHHHQQQSNDNDDESELPLHLYEARTSQDGKKFFVSLNHDLKTDDIERIAVDHVFKCEENKGKRDLVSELTKLRSSIESLNKRVKTLMEYLQKVKTGQVEPNPELLRQISAVLNQLYAANVTPSCRNELHNQYFDMQVMTNLAAVTKSIVAVEGLAKKVQTVISATSFTSSIRSSTAATMGSSLSGLR